MKFYSLHFPIVSGCSGKIFTTSSHSRQRKGSPPSPPGISPGDPLAQGAGWSEKTQRGETIAYFCQYLRPIYFRSLTCWLLAAISGSSWYGSTNGGLRIELEDNVERNQRKALLCMARKLT